MSGDNVPTVTEERTHMKVYMVRTADCDHEGAEFQALYADRDDAIEHARDLIRNVAEMAGEDFPDDKYSVHEQTIANAHEGLSDHFYVTFVEGLNAHGYAIEWAFVTEERVNV
jgi:hypothetical protein